VATETPPRDPSRDASQTYEIEPGDHSLGTHRLLLLKCFMLMTMQSYNFNDDIILVAAQPLIGYYAKQKEHTRDRKKHIKKVTFSIAECRMVRNCVSSIFQHISTSKKLGPAPRDPQTLPPPPNQRLINYPPPPLYSTKGLQGGVRAESVATETPPRDLNPWTIPWVLIGSCSRNVLC